MMRTWGVCVPLALPEGMGSRGGASLRADFPLQWLLFHPFGLLSQGAKDRLLLQSLPHTTFFFILLIVGFPPCLPRLLQSLPHTTLFPILLIVGLRPGRPPLSRHRSRTKELALEGLVSHSCLPGTEDGRRREEFVASSVTPPHELLLPTPDCGVPPVPAPASSVSPPHDALLPTPDCGVTIGQASALEWSLISWNVSGLSDERLERVAHLPFSVCALQETHLTEVSLAARQARFRAEGFSLHHGPVNKVGIRRSRTTTCFTLTGKRGVGVVCSLLRRQRGFL